MNIIAAVDKKWAIGLKNKLLVRIPADMKFFQEETTNKVVVMGRKTMESLPGSQPLKNRVNIVLTSNLNYTVKGAIVVHSLKQLLDELKKYNREDIYIIGGESIYRQLLPMCDTAHITKLNYTYQADTYFPNLDRDPEWEITEVSDEQTYFDLEFCWTKYKRKNETNRIEKRE